MTDTATRLLNAVDDVIAEHGPSGVTLRRVGTQAGLSHTAAAHYFKNKPGLFTAYITRAWDQVADGIISVKDHSEPRQAMLNAAEFFAEFALANPSAFSVMSRLELANVETPELWAARERGFFAVAEIIGRAQQDGWAAQRDTLDLIATCWGLVHGVVDLWVGGPLAAPFDGNELGPTLRRLLEAVLDGLS